MKKNFKKIYNLEELKKKISIQKKKGKKIVHCHGVFDLIHVGHIKHLKSAKENGDFLLVSLTSDKYVNKGPNRPAFDEQNRITALAALKVIDYVALNRNPTAISAIKELKPDFYCKGPDYKSHDDDISGKIKDEVNAINQIGGKIIYIPNRPGEPKKTWANTSKITKELNWKPSIKFKDGVKKMLIQINEWKTAPL